MYEDYQKSLSTRRIKEKWVTLKQLEIEQQRLDLIHGPPQGS